MKKLLLGTSALIGATAIVASASAAPELTIGGNLDFRLVGGETPALYNADTGANLTEAEIGPMGRNAPNANNDVGAANNGFDFTRANSRSEIRFRAAGESDAGTRYGANIDYRYAASSTDEAYIFIADDWGTIHLGDDDGVIDARVPNAGSIAPGAYLIDDTTTYINQESNSDVDGTKVSYFSSDLNGFQFGVSVYESVGVFEDVVELAASYSGEFGGGSFTIGAGYQAGSAVEREAAAATAAELNGAGGSVSKLGTAAVTQRKYEDLAEYVVGATVSFGGFSIAASYNDAGDSGLVTETGGTAQTPNNGEARTYTSLGIAYDLGGGMAVGISTAEAETTAHGGRENTQTLTTLDFGFPIMDGMVGYAGIAASESEYSGGGATSVSADATTYLVGTTVSF